MSTKFVPFTTRPASTSRHGITRLRCIGDHRIAARGNSNSVMNESGPSLAGRTALAVALTIGFYTLALAIAIALIGLPILSVAADGPFNLWLAIFMVVSGITILRAIVPRRHRFEPP